MRGMLFYLMFIINIKMLFICRRIKKGRAEGKTCHAKTVMSKKTNEELK